MDIYADSLDAYTCGPRLLASLKRTKIGGISETFRDVPEFYEKRD